MSRQAVVRSGRRVEYIEETWFVDFSLALGAMVATVVVTAVSAAVLLGIGALLRCVVKALF